MLLVNYSYGCHHRLRLIAAQRQFWTRKCSYLSVNSDRKCMWKKPSSRILLSSDKYLQTKPLISSCRSYSLFESLADAPPVILAQDTLIFIHDYTHLPWWTVILLTTVGVRLLITFPFHVYQSIVLAKYANLQPEIQQIVARLKMETAHAIKLYNWDEKRAKIAFFTSLRKHKQNLIVRDNCHPFKASIVIWTQIPVWVFISCALRNIVSPTQGDVMHYLEMATEGTLWFSNLTIPDPTLVLPLLLGVINLTIVEFHALKASRKQGKLQKGITWFFRGFSILMIPVAASMPSCMSLYWCTSSCIGLLHNVVLTSPNVKKMCRIPSVKGESSTPYRDLYITFKNRFTSGQS